MTPQIDWTISLVPLSNCHFETPRWFALRWLPRTGNRRCYRHLGLQGATPTGTTAPAGSWRRRGGGGGNGGQKPTPVARYHVDVKAREHSFWVQKPVPGIVLVSGDLGDAVGCTAAAAVDSRGPGGLSALVLRNDVCLCPHRCRQLTLARRDVTFAEFAA